MNQEWLYFDYNASTPMATEVVEVMQDSLKAQGHPSSPHPHGRDAANLVEKSRALVATALHCAPEEIVFCSGSTEASNHVIKGIGLRKPVAEKKLHFISSCVDHAATTEPLRFLERMGHEVTFLTVDKHGCINPSELESSLQENTILVTLIHGQNEVGTLQPLTEIGEICQNREVLFHVDASQSFGKVPIQVDELKADFLNIAGHKIYGPKGVGALYIRKGRTLEPLLHGGGHEKGWRSGTPAPQLLAGLGKACGLVTELGPLTSQPADNLAKLLSEQLGSRVRRNGHPEHRLPNVLHLTFEGVNGRELLNRAQISASTGAACHSAACSPVLTAMGFTSAEAAGSVRLSMGRMTTLKDTEAAASRLLKAYDQLRSQSTVEAQ